MNKKVLKQLPMHAVSLYYKATNQRNSKICMSMT